MFKSARLLLWRNEPWCPLRSWPGTHRADWISHWKTRNRAHNDCFYVHTGVFVLPSNNSGIQPWTMNVCIHVFPQMWSCDSILTILAQVHKQQGLKPYFNLMAKGFERKFWGLEKELRSHRGQELKFINSHCVEFDWQKKLIKQQDVMLLNEEEDDRHELASCYYSCCWHFMCKRC